MKKVVNESKKVEWCKNWIIGRFTKHHPYPLTGGIATFHFWKLAEKSGLYEKGTYGSPMSIALEELTTVEDIKDADGNYSYSVFRLKNSVIETLKTA